MYKIGVFCTPRCPGWRIDLNRNRTQQNSGDTSCDSVDANHLIIHQRASCNGYKCFNTSDACRSGMAPEGPSATGNWTGITTCRSTPYCNGPREIVLPQVSTLHGFPSQFSLEGSNIAGGNAIRKVASCVRVARILDTEFTNVVPTISESYSPNTVLSKLRNRACACLFH